MDDIKRAESRGYSRGYAAGKKRITREDAREAYRKSRQEFLDKAFLSVLPVAMQVQGWKFGDQPIASSDDRIKLAAIWAKNALHQRPIA